MNDRQLFYFIVIAEEKSIGRAAKQLPLTVSALSRQIRSLEEELGVPLFDRTTSGLELTPAGNTLLEHARTLRAQIEQAKSDVQRVGTALVGQLDVGGIGSTMLHHVPQILKRFRRYYPGITTVMHSLPLSQQFELLRHGKLTMSFDRVSQVPQELVVELVREESPYVALPANHPLTAQSVVNFSELRGEPIIGRRHGGFMNQEEQALSKLYGFELRVVQDIEDMVSATAMVGCGIGITIVAESMKSAQIANVVYRPLVTDQISLRRINLYCYYSQWGPIPPCSRPFSESCVSIATKVSNLQQQCLSRLIGRWRKSDPANSRSSWKRRCGNI